MDKLLIDGDVIAWRIASKFEEAIEFGDGLFTWWADMNKAEPEVEFFVNELLRRTETDDMVVCLSDTKNFRKEVLPTYKSNRANRYTPLLVSPIKQYLSRYFESVTWDTLEADDVMGILATAPYTKDTFVIATIDKDLQQIPGYHYNWDKDENGVFHVTNESATRFFYQQIISGDAVDGYSGCKNIGPVKAKRVIDENWEQGPAHVWKEIVKLYEKQNKLTNDQAEESAKSQARCARILQHGEYDAQSGRLKLWEPEK